MSRNRAEFSNFYYFVRLSCLTFSGVWTVSTAWLFSLANPLKPTRSWLTTTTFHSSTHTKARLANVDQVRANQQFNESNTMTICHFTNKNHFLIVNCRGVIGGRTQRVTPSGESGDRRKKTSASGSLAKGKNASAAADAASQSTSIANQVSRSAAIATLVAPPVKPLSLEQKEFIVAHRCFLFRNFEKIR